MFFLTLDQTRLSRLFNSDILLLEDVHQTLTRNWFELSDWVFPPANYLFPDLVLYSSLRIFIDDFRPVIVFFSLLQTLLILFFLKQFVGEKSFLIAFLLFCLPCLYEFNMNGGCSYEFFISFLMVHHTLTYLTALWARSAKRKGLLYSLVLIATAFSDKFFILYFIIPMTCEKLLRKKSLPFLEIGLICSGVLLWKFSSEFLNYQSLSETSNIQFSIYQIVSSLYFLIEDLRSKPYLLWLLLFSIATSLIGLGLSFFSREKLKSYSQKGEPQAVSSQKLASQEAIIFLSIQLALTTLVPVALGFYQAGAVRYFILPLLFLFAVSTTIVLRYCSKFLQLSCLILILTFISLQFYYLLKIPNYNPLSYYPKRIRCLDEAFVETKAKIGIADYWNARQIEFLARSDVKILATNSKLTHRGAIGDQSSLPETVDFIITDRLNKTEIVAKFGKPKNFKQCRESGIYFY